MACFSTHIPTLSTQFVNSLDFKIESVSLFILPDRTTVKVIAVVVMFGFGFLAISVNDDLPSRIVVPWAKGECYWLNGTIVSKEMVDDGMTTDYRWYIVGTLDNETEFNSIVHGTKTEYALIPAGIQYEGQVCDTMTLREAVVNGTVEIVDWVVG